MARYYKRKSAVKRRRYGALKRKRSFRRKSRFTRRVKRAVDQFAEKKYWDISYAATAVSNTGIVSYLNNALPSAGTGDSNRIGSKVRMRSIKINFLATPGSGVNSINQYFFRVIVGCWKDFISTVPAASTILTAPTNQTLSPYYREYLQAKKWIPMYDKKFTLAKLNVGANDATSKTWSVNFAGKTLPMKNVEFASSNDHVYFVLVISNYVGLSGGEPYIQYYARCTFTDV